MDTSQIVNVLDAITRLIQAISWPVVTTILALYFGRPLKRLIVELSEGTVKIGAGGIEASAKRPVEAIAALAMAAATKTSTGGALGESRQLATVAEVIGSVSTAAEPHQARLLANVLWVDDEPANNVYEVHALQALGFRVAQVTSTEAAIRELQHADRRFAAVISDMTRGTDRTAAYTLEDQKQRIKDTTPILVYSRTASKWDLSEVTQRGIFAVTDRPSELLRLVVIAAARQN